MGVELVVRDVGVVDTVFLAHDDVPCADLGFRVRDSDDGRPLDGCLASIQVHGRSTIAKRLEAKAPVLSLLPDELPLRWRLDLDGYRPAAGDRTAFTVEEPRDGRLLRIAEVDLRRGWGEVFRVMSKPNNRPIQGAVVRLDGRVAGTTGSDGTVLADAPEKPVRVEIVYRDWSLSSPLDLRPAPMRREKRFVTAWLSPPGNRPGR